MFIILLILVQAQTQHHEQYLMDIYNYMTQIKSSISQLDFYTALEKLQLQAQIQTKFEEENLIIYQDLLFKLFNLDEQYKLSIKYLQDDVSIFIHDTYSNSQNLLKRLVNEKEKLIEGDIKELSKIKHQQKENPKKLFEEYSFLQQQINGVLDIDNSNELYKTLELIESKIMIGIFKQYHSKEELNYLIKEIDNLFKQSQSQNQIEKSKAIQLLSIINNIISEIQLSIMNSQLEEQLDILDKQLFFSESKSTHIQSKESLQENIINNQNKMEIWKNIILSIQEELDVACIESLNKSLKITEISLLNSKEHYYQFENMLTQLLSY